MATPMSPNPDRWTDAEGAADILRCRTSGIYDLVDSGMLSKFQIGKYTLYWVPQVTALVRQSRNAAAGARRRIEEWTQAEAISAWYYLCEANAAVVEDAHTHVIERRKLVSAFLGDDDDQASAVQSVIDNHVSHGCAGHPLPLGE